MAVGDEGWVPPDQAYCADTNVGRFIAAHGLADFRELERRAATEPEWFFPRALEAASFEFTEPYRLLRDETAGVAHARWFVGAQTNLAEQIVRRWAGSTHEVALIWQSESGDHAQLTASQLDESVRRLAFGLIDSGVRPGDTVGLCMAMTGEAAIALLGIAAVGAIACPIFTGYEVESIAERIQLAGCRLVLASSAYRRRGRLVSLADRVEAAASLVAEPPTVVSTQNDGTSSWDDLLGRGILAQYPSFDASTPYTLAFTSGSTGRPKAAVHVHGGLPVKFMLELFFSMNLEPGNRLGWITDMGWGAGPNSLIGTLLNKATYVMYESVPDFPDPGRLWELVEDWRLTHLGLTPTIVRNAVASGDSWVASRDVTSLRAVISTAEPWTLPAWRWLHQVVGRGQVPIINYTGGTEAGGGILVGSPVVETPAGRFSGTVLGMQVDCVDDAGNSVTDVEGELVVRGSWPGMTQGLWREGDRYLESYWKTFDGCWHQGDRVIRHGDGTWSVLGRSDEVLKVGGKRIGPTEYESVATECAGVEAAAAVSVFNSDHGTQAILAVKRAPGVAPDEVQELVIAAIGERIGRAMVPKVLVVDDLPLTATYKVHRRAVRAWLVGDDAGDVSTIVNLSAEESVRAAGAALS